MCIVYRILTSFLTNNLVQPYHYSHKPPKLSIQAHFYCKMFENLLAGLIDGLIYVLSKEAKNRNINLNHEAQRANFDKDLTEYVNQVTKEIEEDEKVQDEVEMTADKEAVEYIKVITQRF